MLKPLGSTSAVKSWKLEGPPALRRWVSPFLRFQPLGCLAPSASYHVSFLFLIRHCFGGQIRLFDFFFSDFLLRIVTFLWAIGSKLIFFIKTHNLKSFDVNSSINFFFTV